MNSSFDFLDLTSLDRMDLVSSIRQGLSTEMVESLSLATKLPRERIIKGLRISRATYARKRADGRPLPIDASERLLGLGLLLGQAQKMAKESGASEQEIASVSQIFGRWIEMPNPALDGQKPIDGTGCVKRPGFGELLFF